MEQCTNGIAALGASGRWIKSSLTNGNDSLMSREFYKGIHAPLGNQRKQRNNEREEQKQVVDSDSLCKSPAQFTAIA